MEEPFKIRSYGYGELALQYFPKSTKKSASTQFGRWIRHNDNLKKQLEELGYKLRRKIFTPNQVRLIVDFFGEP
jgi:hypothetical protein